MGHSNTAAPRSITCDTPDRKLHQNHVVVVFCKNLRCAPGLQWVFHRSSAGSASRDCVRVAVPIAGRPIQSPAELDARRFLCDPFCVICILKQRHPATPKTIRDLTLRFETPSLNADFWFTSDSLDAASPEQVWINAPEPPEVLLEDSPFRSKSRRAGSNLRPEDACGQTTNSTNRTRRLTNTTDVT